MRHRLVGGEWVPVDKLRPSPVRGTEIKVAPNVGFSSISLPLNWPYAPRHNAQGEAVFHSQREVREAVARANGDGEKVVYE